jgi:dTDP-4-amino-4,6-dideoxygalactose transaminase
VSDVANPRLVPFLNLAGTTAEVRTVVLAHWERILDTGGFVGGEVVEEFEAAFSRYCGTLEAVGVGNGTDALHLTLRALGIGPGDGVIVPANTFVATVEAIVLAGAHPQFADVDEDTLLLTPESIARAFTPASRAVIVVHLYGHMPNMEEILDAASALELLVVEDAAQAQGASWAGRPAGSWGAAGCFSFYPGKNLGAFGDAGAVTTSDPELAARLRSMRDHGRGAGGHHTHEVLGTNSRLDAVQAVVLHAKLARLDAWNLARRELVSAYQSQIHPDVGTLVTQPPGGRGVHHLAVLRVDDRVGLQAALAARGIVTGVHYPNPCHRMSPYRGFADGPLPVAERAAGEVLSLPLYPHMEPETVEYVASSLSALTRRDQPA